MTTFDLRVLVENYGKARAKLRAAMGKKALIEALADLHEAERDLDKAAAALLREHRPRNADS